MSEAERIAKSCGEASAGSGGWNCLCPGHKDSQPSAHISARPGGGILITCRAGCSQSHLIEELKRRNLWAKQVLRRTLTGEWFYHNADGTVTLKIQRWDKPDGNKDYFPIQPDGNGGWLPATTKGWEPVLYNLPAVRDMVARGGCVFVVEGEKCADSINQRGLCATTWQGGAKRRWLKTYTETLRGATVVLIYDNDQAGKDCMDRIAMSLAEAGIKSRVMGLPDVGAKGDVYDWFYIGGTVEKLKELVRAAKPWEPPAFEDTPISNVVQFPESESALPVRKGAIDTDVANAARFIRDHGRDVRWTPESRWYVWDGKRFVVDKTNQVRQLAIETADRIYAEMSTAEIEDRKPLMKWAKQSQSRGGLTNMVHLAEHKLSASDNDFDADPWLLNCNNAVIDLKTGRVVDREKEMMMSKINGIDFNADASCPQWEAFLNSTQRGDAEMIGFLKRAVGSTLTGITRDQKVFFVYGPGGNGKSIFLNTILDLAGEYGEPVRAKMFMQKQNESQIDNIGITAGKRLITVSEIAANDRLDESLVKDFSGGDPIRGRTLYKESYQFKPVGKLFFRGNHKPYVQPNDDGIWRRLLLIPFTVAFPDGQRDEDLQWKLKQELPGILNWAIAGCLEWQRIGLCPPQSVLDETEAFRQENDAIGEFLMSHCVISPDVDVKASDLFKAYREFCIDENRFVGNKPTFSRELEKRGFVHRRGAGGWFRFFGVALK